MNLFVKLDTIVVASVDVASNEVNTELNLVKLNAKVSHLTYFPARTVSAF